MLLLLKIQYCCKASSDLCCLWMHLLLQGKNTDSYSNMSGCCGFTPTGRSARTYCPKRTSVPGLVICWVWVQINAHLHEFLSKAPRPSKKRKHDINSFYKSLRAHSQRLWVAGLDLNRKEKMIWFELCVTHIQGYCWTVKKVWVTVGTAINGADLSPHYQGRLSDFAAAPGFNLRRVKCLCCPVKWWGPL